MLELKSSSYVAHITTNYGGIKMILKLKRPANIFVAIDFPWLNKTLNDGRKFQIDINSSTFSEGIQLALQTSVDEDGKVHTTNLPLNPQISGHLFYDQLTPISESFEEAMEKFTEVGLDIFPIRKESFNSHFEHREIFSKMFRERTMRIINEYKYEIIVIVSNDQRFLPLIKGTKKQIYFFSDDSMKDVKKTQWRDFRRIHWYKYYEARKTHDIHEDILPELVRA